MKFGQCALSFMAASLLSWAVPASAQTARCAPDAESGWISSLEISELGRRGTPPKILAGKRWLPIEEGAPLCAHDKIVNPADSRRVVRIRIAGEAPVPIEPGTDFVIPELGLGRVFAMLARRILPDKVPDRAPQAIPGASRGPACVYRPGDPELFAYAIRGMGPLHVSWPCDRDDGPWELIFIARSGKRLLAGMPTTNFADLPMDECEPDCTLMISDMKSGKAILIVLFKPVDLDEAKLPRELTQLPAGAPRAALIGAELSRRRAHGWRLQGHSLLYGTACYVPAAGRLAKMAFGYVSQDEPCLALDARAVPTQ